MPEEKEKLFISISNVGCVFTDEKGYDEEI